VSTETDGLFANLSLSKVQEPGVAFSDFSVNLGEGGGGASAHLPRARRSQRVRHSSAVGGAPLRAREAAGGGAVPQSRHTRRPDNNTVQFSARVECNK